jgi:hypothetical protein
LWYPKIIREVVLSPPSINGRVGVGPLEGIP